MDTDYETDHAYLSTTDLRRAGFTLVEVLITAFIMVIVFGAFLNLINGSFKLQDNGRNFILVSNAARSKIEEIRSVAFDNIVGSFNNTVFDVPGFMNNYARGRVTAIMVNGSGGDLIDIRVVICWRQKDGRIIGEDNGQGGGTALNGVLDGSEDVNGNGRIDSPCVLSSAINRTQ